jgi:shikimate kinase
MIGFNYGECSTPYPRHGRLSTTSRSTGPTVSDPVTAPGATAAATAGTSIVLVGLMGAGKTKVGRLLARRLEMPFVDADDEIVAAAGCSIEEIFQRFGETAFRDGERRVVARLLDGEPMVLATGGGAFVDPDTRARIKRRGISVWLRAELDVLVKRTSRRGGRPLLKNRNIKATLEKLMAERYPIYAEADIVVDSGWHPVDITVQRVVDALAAFAVPARVGSACVEGERRGR